MGVSPDERAANIAAGLQKAHDSHRRFVNRAIKASERGEIPFAEKPRVRADVESRVRAMEDIESRAAKQGFKLKVGNIVRGVLSPAGLAEGVAGSVAKLSDKAGRQKLQQAMHAKDKVKMPPPPKPGKKRA